MVGADTVFIFPDRRGSDRLYDEIGKFFRKKGINTEFVEPDWDDLETAVEYIEKELKIRLKNYDRPRIYFFGHGTGAVAALTASTGYDTEAQILASMPPEFREDRDEMNLFEKVMERAWKTVNPFAFNTGSRPSLSGIAETETGEIHLIHSRKEFGLLNSMERVVGNRVDILGAEQETVKGGKLGKGSEAYLDEINRITAEL